MKKNIISLIIYIVMTNMLFNCQKSKNMTETYSYETGSGCADNYPVNSSDIDHPISIQSDQVISV